MRCVLTVVVLLTGCTSATMTQVTSALWANAEGNRAYYQGKYEYALSQFENSLELAKASNDAEFATISMYSLARTYRQLRDFVAAEEWFKKSIAAREQLLDSKYARISQNLLEYARFLLARDRTAEAIPLFERAIPRLDSAGVDKSDPIAFADVLSDYSAALSRLGRSEEAGAASSRATSLRDANPGRVAVGRSEPPPRDCAVKTP